MACTSSHENLASRGEASHLWTKFAMLRSAKWQESCMGTRARHAGSNGEAL
jgi:hypothetical protein